MNYNGIERPDYTPDYISELKEDEIFVFGSNLEGMHDGGAAYIAFRRFGAVMRYGVGLQGQSYAIPTMQGGVETIKPYVDDFIAFAKAHPELFFYVTRIGCGIAGFNDSEIAPLFAEATKLANVCLPESFLHAGPFNDVSDEEKLLLAFSREESLFEACHLLLREGLHISYKPGSPNAWPLDKIVSKAFMEQSSMLYAKVHLCYYLGKTDRPAEDCIFYCMEAQERLNEKEVEDLTLAFTDECIAQVVVFIRTAGKFLTISTCGFTEGKRRKIKSLYEIDCSSPKKDDIDAIIDLISR